MAGAPAPPGGGDFKKMFTAYKNLWWFYLFHNILYVMFGVWDERGIIIFSNVPSMCIVQSDLS